MDRWVSERDTSWGPMRDHKRFGLWVHPKRGWGTVVELEPAAVRRLRAACDKFLKEFDHET